MAREKGYARLPSGEISRTREDNWELQWPQSLRIYAKMSREDAQVKSVIKAVTQPISRTNWYIEPNGADASVVKTIAEDLNLPVKGEEIGSPVSKTPRRVSWRQHMRRALKWQVIYGHAFFELIWDDATTTEDGLTHLRKIAPRNPDTIVKIEVEDDGGLKSITQRGTATRGESTLPVKDLLVYLHDDDNDDWVGESMLRAAYKHWRLKDEVLRLEQLVLNRNGMGLPVATANAYASDDDMDRLEQIVSDARAGAESSAVLKDGEKLEFKGVSGTTPNTAPVIAYHDSQIARTALAHALNLDGKGGSYALAEVQMDMFFQGLNDLAATLTETANQHLIRDMVYMLTGNTDGPFPIITFDKIEQKRSLTPTDIAALKNAGLIFADPGTESHLRRIYELPPQQPREEYVTNPAEINALLPAARALIEIGIRRDDAFEVLGLDPRMPPALTGEQDWPDPYQRSLVGAAHTNGGGVDGT